MIDKTHFLILVKHSLPEIIPGTPADQWRLSDHGRARCEPLGEKLAAYKPGAIFSSLEPKAIETAELAATAIRLGNQAQPGLHEHLRQTVGYLKTKSEFQAAVAHCFDRPDQVVFGEESANQAQARFSAAVDHLLAGMPGQTIVVVAHGTVITLFSALHNAIDLYPFWEQLTLPSFVVLARPSLILADIVLFP